MSIIFRVSKEVLAGLEASIGATGVALENIAIGFLEEYATESLYLNSDTVKLNGQIRGQYGYTELAILDEKLIFIDTDGHYTNFSGLPIEDRIEIMKKIIG
jgi:hypothetical protein